jgi:cytochrome c-type biogenesis protein CcmH/NrfG
VRLQPLNWRAWYELGRFEEDLEEWRRALPPLHRAVELDPLNPLVTSELARARDAAG